MSTPVWIGVGANIGDRQSFINQAKALLTRVPKLHFRSVAPIYETDPVGSAGQRRFLNTVWEIETELSPYKLLSELMKSESILGRKRTSEKNEPRVIDLDILLYGDQIVQDTELTIPHPRMHERWFVLKPLLDLRRFFCRTFCWIGFSEAEGVGV